MAVHEATLVSFLFPRCVGFFGVRCPLLAFFACLCPPLLGVFLSGAWVGGWVGGSGFPLFSVCVVSLSFLARVVSWTALVEL